VTDRVVALHFGRIVHDASTSSFTAATVE